MGSTSELRPLLLWLSLLFCTLLLLLLLRLLLLLQRVKQLLQFGRRGSAPKHATCPPLLSVVWLQLPGAVTLPV